MGPSQSKLIENISVNHPNFKSAEAILHQDNPYMKTKLILHNTRNLQEWEKTQKLAESMDATYLLLPVDHKVEKNAFCGPSAVLSVIYENFPIILSDEVENRGNCQEYFQEVEVWYLLHILISTSTLFHQHQTKLGDIRPQSIFINKDGRIKLANVFSWPNVENNYFKSLSENEITYLAPQELEDLGARNPKPASDPYKAESFSIGLTLLGVMLLYDCHKLYDIDNFSFDAKQLQNLLGKLNAEKLYSAFLRSIVTSLLDLNPKTRKSPKEVEQLTRPYQYQMKNLIEFQAQIPQKSYITTTPFNIDPRSSQKSQDNANQNRYSYNTNAESRYNYTSNLPTYSPQKYNFNFKDGSYYTQIPNKVQAVESSQVTPGFSSIDALKFMPSPNYTSTNQNPNYRTETYVPKTLQQIYNSINVKDTKPVPPSSNYNNSLPSSYHQPTQSPTQPQKLTFQTLNKNLQVYQPQPINPSQPGARTPGSTIPWSQVDKYIEISKQLYQ